MMTDIDTLPEREATPDEAFELGRVRGYDEAMLDMSPRVVSTVAELDALPVGSVVMETIAEPFMGIPTIEGVFHKFPEAVQESGREWFVVSGHGARSALEIELPVRVLWVGGTE